MKKYLKEFNLYGSKSQLKLVAIFVSFLISVSSIYYTNTLVEELKEREHKLIDLYAHTIEYAANETNSDVLTFIFQEIIVTNTSIPVILTDEKETPIEFKNINISERASEAEKRVKLEKELREMKNQHEPVVIKLKNNLGEITGFNYVFYKNSNLLSQLKYYPYIQLSVIAAFAIIVYMALSYSKTAEQNRVWVGLAKETAHQLGTPLSSLMAWVEYFKSMPEVYGQEIINELEKDVTRFEMITSRFSNIGSLPVLKEENVYETVKATVNYLQGRISSKVKVNIRATSTNVYAKLNRALFDWVIENICKNAVDAMGGVGTIDIYIIKANEGMVVIDITDNGKGIPKSHINKVFQPGFTTKQRGWGLGLTLAERIIERYHSGRIFVKSSEVGVGTTFRIMLKG